MIDELYEEASLVADCRNDEVIAEAHARSRRDISFRKLLRSVEEAEENGVGTDNVHFYLKDDDVAFAVIHEVGHMDGKTNRDLPQ